MKTIIKIAIMTGLIAFVSACQKEDIPFPAGSSSTNESAANQRIAGSPGTAGDTIHSVIDDEKQTSDEVVGGGDDDRDGGGKRVIKGN